MVGGHLRGVGEHGDGQRGNFYLGGGNKGRRLAPGSYSQQPEALLFQEDRPPVTPGQKRGLWVNFKLLGLAFKAPWRPVTHLITFPTPAFWPPWLIYSVFRLFAISRDSQDFGWGARIGTCFS